MKFLYEIFPSQQAILIRLHGTFTLRELLAGADRLWSDSRYSPAFDGFVDLTAIDLGVEMSDFRPLLEYLKSSPHTSTGRLAIVAPSPLAAACALIYRRALSGRQTIEVFSTRDAACGFLGLRIDGDDMFAAGVELQRN